MEGNAVLELLVSIDSAAARAHIAWIHIMNISTAATMVAVTEMSILRGAAAMRGGGHGELVRFEDIKFRAQLGIEVSITIVVSA